MKNTGFRILGGNLLERLSRGAKQADEHSGRCPSPCHRASPHPHQHGVRVRVFRSLRPHATDHGSDGTRVGDGVLRANVKSHTSRVTRHTSHVTRHTSHVTRHTSHATSHTSHITRHTSHVTRHTPQVTRHTCSCHCRLTSACLAISSSASGHRSSSGGT